MKRVLFAIAACLLSAAACLAQSTTVSGTITDTGGQAWAGGTYRIEFNANGKNPPYVWNGTPFVPAVYSGSLDGAGSFSGIAVPSNTSIAPVGTLWKFTICPAATSPCYIQNLSIVGTTLSVSSLIRPPPIQVNASAYNQPTAYQDSEIVGPIVGFTYFNLTDNTLHLCTVGIPCTWVSVVGGGGNPAGNVGDLQLKASATAFGASHFNDTGSQMNLSESLAVKGPRPWIDVTDPAFAGGADPTGVADSTAAINAAMLFACPGASANPQFPPQNCGYDIYFPPTGPPNYEYKVTQPQSPSNLPVFPYVASGMHFIGGNAGVQSGASPSPPQAIISATCGASPGKGPVFEGGYTYGNNLTFDNLYVSGCNEAFFTEGAFFEFNNVTATAQNQSAGGTYGQGTAPYYNAPVVFLDTLNIKWNGGAIFSNGTSYPAMVLGGDNCTPISGSDCPNIVGLAYFSNLLMAGGKTLYLQSADINGSPPGHIGFTNIDYESNLGPAFVVANTSNAYTSITALEFKEVVDSDQTITPGNTIDPLVQFNLTNPGGGRTNGISGLTIDHSQGSGYAVEVLNGTSLDNYIANGCQSGCDTTALDASGNLVADGTVLGRDGIDTVMDSSSLNHLLTSQRTVAGNQFGYSGGVRASRKGSQFASYGIDAVNGLMFGDNTLPGWYASIGSPLTSTYPNQLNISWASTYAPTSVAATPSNTGGSLVAGTYYIYMVSTTGTGCGGADTSGMSAPSAIAGPYTITGSSGSLAVTWTASIPGPATNNGYCVFSSSGTYNPGNVTSAFISGASTASATVTSFPNAPSALPVYNNYTTTYQLLPTTAILASISLPFASSAPPWTPTCIGAGTCGSYLQPSLLATDNFNRATTAPCTIGACMGANWGPAVTTSGFAQLNILSNKAVANQYLGGGDPSTMPYTALNVLPDQFVRATIGTIINGSTDGIGVVARQAGGGTDTEYMFECFNGASLIIKRIAGTQTTLQGGGPACAGGNTIELDAVGTNLFASINGSQVLTASDSSITSGYTGLFIYGINDTVTSWTGGSMTIGRGAQTLFAQQNWWTGAQSFYGNVLFPNLADGCLETSSHVVVSTGSPCGSGGGGGVTSLNTLTGALTIAAGVGISVTPSGSTITITNTGSSGANTALSNLVTTAINQSLIPASGSAGTLTLGSQSIPWLSLVIGNAANDSATFTGTFTSNRTITVPDASGTLAINGSGPITLSGAGMIGCASCVTSSGGGALTATSPLNFNAGTNVLSITGLAGGILAGAGPTFTVTPTLGVAGTTLGTLTLAASAASATLTLSPASVLTSYSLVFPTAAGTSGNLLTYGSPMTWTSPTVTINSTPCTLGSTCSVSAAASLSSLTAATGSNSINNGLNAQTWNWSLTGSSNISAMTFTENTASTNSGTSYLVNIHTIATSTISPFFVGAGGTSSGWAMNSSGLWEPIGSSTIALGGTAHSLTITEGVSTGINFLNSPTTNGYCVVGFNITSSAAADPTCALLGVPVNLQSSSYTLLYSDRASEILFTGGATATLTLPAHTTTGFGANFPFVSPNFDSGNLTTTATSPDTIDGGSAGGSVTTIPNFVRFFYNNASGNWQSISMPMFAAFGSTCGDATHALNWSTTAGFGCQSISGGGGGSSALSSITAATATNTISSGNFGSQIWEWALTTNNTNALQLTESSVGSATGSYLLNVTTLAGSTTVPATFADSLTGSQNLPVLKITGTWNTSAKVDAAFLVNMTNTASGAGSLLMDLQIGGTSEFTVDKAGNANAATSMSTGTAPSCAAGTAGVLCLASGTAPTSASNVLQLFANGSNIPQITINATGPFDLPYESSTFTTNGLVYATAANTLTSTAAGATGQLYRSNGSGSAPTATDLYIPRIIPAANSNAGTAGAGWSIPSSSGGVPTSRAGTNNLGAYISITDSTTAQFMFVLPEDWDTGVDPYIRFQIASADTTSGHTIIPQFKISCAKGDGSTTDDVSFNAAHSTSTITLNTTANQFWSTATVQMNSTDVTGCVAGALMIVQVGRATDTATSANFYSATITVPEVISAQAN